MTYHNEYRQLWVDAGYRPDMGSACAVKPPPEGYLAAYHFTSAQHAIDDITNLRIKVTRIDDANDPFEFAGLSTMDDAVRDEITSWKEQASKEIGLLCFSKDWRSPALWAHYSARHCGICLGFWAKKATLQEVVYNNQRTDIAYKDRPRGLSTGIKKFLLTVKAQDWSYEEEVRRCVKLTETIEVDGKQYFQFDDTLKLSEIILGARYRETPDYVRSLLPETCRGVAVFQARPAHGFFKMVPDEPTIP
jgi:hypothetical protein